MHATGRTIALGLCAVEGPVLGPSGWILNVCSFTRPEEDWPTVGGDIVATHPEEPLRTLRLLNTCTPTTTGIPAALAFGPDSCLYAADEGHRAILRIDACCEATRFIDAFAGSPINGPNDLSFDNEGNLFFTDPWGSSPTNPTGRVYGYCWETEELFGVADGMRFPNGIIARDEVLYVAETFTRTIWKYDIVGAGRAANRRKLCELPDVPGAAICGPDGMELDEHGNLYVAHYGSGAVWVFSPTGESLHQIELPGAAPTNLCFGGPDRDHLYVTIDDTGTLTEVDAPTRGAVLPFCPSQTQNHPFGNALVNLPLVS